MKALLTNDDSIYAPGLHLLEEVAREVFSDTVTVAPEREMSGVGHSLSLHQPLRLSEHGPNRFSVSGTPVDSVFVALGHICKDERPDIVLSGINNGPNIGFDIYYSGTVGAAREAAIHRVPAMAFSLVGRPPFDFDAIRPIVKHILICWYKAKDKIEMPALINVNIPVPRPDAIDASFMGVKGIYGIQATALGERYYGNEVVARHDPRGKPYFWIGGAFPEIEDVANTDCVAVRDGWVSITALKLDVTDLQATSKLRSIFDAT